MLNGMSKSISLCSQPHPRPQAALAVCPTNISTHAEWQEATRVSARPEAAKDAGAVKNSAASFSGTAYTQSPVVERVMRGVEVAPASVEVQIPRGIWAFLRRAPQPPTGQPERLPNVVRVAILGIVEFFQFVNRG